MGTEGYRAAVARQAVVVGAALLCGAVPGAAAEPRVVATVDGQPVTDRDIDRQLAESLGERPVAPAAQESLRSEALKRLIDRRLVAGFLAQNGHWPSADDIDVELKRITKRLALQDVALADYLRHSGLSMDEFRGRLAWQTGWRRYVERYLTDDNLQRYFDRHRRDFDGTEVHAAHIFFPVEPAGGQQALAEALEQAERVRRQIQSGQLGFAEAAKRYSQAPTAQRGGDIGYIGRHQPMPESFSKAAFALEKGQISEPVVSSAGVHLIRCLDVKPGAGTWQQARAALMPAVMQYLFQWAADQQRPRATIEIK